jgi:hypothetical protein
MWVDEGHQIDLSGFDSLTIGRSAAAIGNTELSEKVFSEVKETNCVEVLSLAHRAEVSSFIAKRFSSVKKGLVEFCERH